jgi:hypothetical protein
VHNALADIPGPTVKKNPIDWILTRGLRTVRAEWITNPASDHPVARADLELARDLVSQTSTAAPADAIHN